MENLLKIIESTSTVRFFFSFCSDCFGAIIYLFDRFYPRPNLRQNQGNARNQRALNRRTRRPRRMKPQKAPAFKNSLPTKFIIQKESLEYYWTP